MEAELLGGTTTQDGANIIKQVGLGGELTLLGLIPCGAKSLATWDDGYFDQRIAKFKQPADGGMTSLMDSYCSTLLKG